MTKQKVNDTYYALHFSCQYETIVGQSIAVIGDLEELGAWKTIKCNLVWTDGHIWQSAKPIIVRQDWFEYKYVLIEDLNKDGKFEFHEMQKWENGINRIADLDCMDEIMDFSKEKTDTVANIDKSNLKLLEDRQTIPE